jgi:hypothetical protein
LEDPAKGLSSHLACVSDHLFDTLEGTERNRTLSVSSLLSRG